MSSKSGVWDYFEKETDSEKAKCDLCGSQLSYRGGSTSILRNHLKFKHPSIDLAAKRQPTSSVTKITEEKSSTSEVMVSGPTQKNKPSTSQSKISGFLQKPPMSKKSKEWREITESLAKFVARDMRPISIVDGIGFKEFCQMLNNRYEVPSHTTVKNYVDRLYNEERDKLITLLKTQKNIGITTDAWTSVATEAYVTVTVHFITPEWTQVNRIMSTHETTDRHTGVNLANDMREVLERFEVPNEVIRSITTDNAANMDVCVRELEWTHIRCFGHSLQLSVKAGLDLNPIIRAVAAGRKVVSFFHKSTNAANALKLKQNLLQLPEHRLIQDVSTRWNSTYYMLTSLLEQRLAILAVLHDSSIIKSADAKVLDVADRDWLIIQDLVVILKPLEVATTVISAADFPTISMVYPIVHGLITIHLAPSDNDSTEMRNVKTKITADLTKRYLSQDDDTLTSNILVKGSALDPRYKKMMFLNDGQKDMVWKNIFEEAKQEEKDEEGVTADYQPPIKKKSALEFLIICPTDSSSSDFSTSADKQIERYINEVSLEPDFSPLEWWKVSCKRYPTLSKLARKYLGLPATSVPSERVFSDAGNTVTKKRSNLDTGTVNHLIFLRDALKYNSR